MYSQKMACIYYPTTTLLVDDSHRFLNNMALALDKNLPYKLHHDPIQALNELQKDDAFNTLPDIISTDLSSENYGSFSEKYPISLNISELYHTIYNPKRFSQVSVVVVDYAMPQMTGLEFCEQLQRTNVKKIMLTGAADETAAVMAFNRGLIDRFILKSQTGMEKFLTESIYELQKQSFQSLSEVVIKGLASEGNVCITDPKFIQFFDKLCQNLVITDYYLIDTSGSFLLLDMKGAPAWLLIKNEDEMEDLIIQAIDMQAPKNVITALKNREKIAYFNTLYEYARVQGIEWERAVHPAKKLEGTGNKEYFYCIIKELPDFILDRSRVTSLKDYMIQFRNQLSNQRSISMPEVLDA